MIRNKTKRISIRKFFVRNLKCILHLNRKFKLAAGLDWHDFFWDLIDIIIVLCFQGFCSNNYCLYFSFFFPMNCICFFKKLLLIFFVKPLKAPTHLDTFLCVSLLATRDYKNIGLFYCSAVVEGKVHKSYLLRTNMFHILS